jgi:hypothetical protein
MQIRILSDDRDTGLGPGHRIHIYCIERSKAKDKLLHLGKKHFLKPLRKFEAFSSVFL